MVRRNKQYNGDEKRGGKLTWYKTRVNNGQLVVSTMLDP